MAVITVPLTTWRGASRNTVKYMVPKRTHKIAHVCLHFDSFHFQLREKIQSVENSGLNMLPEKNSASGKIRFPKQHSRICSHHFMDAEPTTENPYPTLNMGHDIRMEAKGRRTVIKQDLPSKQELIRR